MKVIDTQHEFATAWLEATRHLVAKPSHDEYSLFLYIEKPLDIGPRSKFILEEYEKILQKKDNSLNMVADTIFPSGMYLRNKRDWSLMRNEYLEKYEWIKGHSSNAWGTYAHRLLHRELLSGEIIDPLGCVIDKINKWVIELNKPYKASYEIDFFDESLDVSIYRGTTDRNRPYGGPCLSHLSFKVDADKRLHITALYRSHYYLEKALGNLFGLSRLLRAMCEQTNLRAGSMTCLSTYGLLDTGASRSGLVLKEVESFIKLSDEFGRPNP